MSDSITGSPSPETAATEPIVVTLQLTNSLNAETTSAIAESAQELTFKPFAQHSRERSFHVNYSLSEISQLAKEVYDESIADVHLSLFTFWVVEDPEHYMRAKACIRELGLDQGYQTSRIGNSCLRRLLEDTHKSRPSAPTFASSSASIKSDSTPPPPVPIKSAARFPTHSSTHHTPSSVKRATDSEKASIYDLPPNTPDRPAPLNFKSRGSSDSGSNNTPAPKTSLLRSVSSPVRMGSLREERGLSSLALEASDILASFSLSTEDDDGESEGTAEDNKVEDDTFRFRRHGTVCPSVPDLFTSGLDPRESTSSLQRLLGDLYESDLDTDTASLAESDRTATTTSLFDRSRRVYNEPSTCPFESPASPPSSQGGVRTHRRTPATVIRTAPNQIPPSLPLPEPRSRLPAFASHITPTSTGSGFSPEHRRSTTPLASPNEYTPLESCTTDTLAHFHPQNKHYTNPDTPPSPQLLPQTNSTLAPRRYEISPPSNTTSNTTLDLPLRQESSQISLSSFRQHRELKAARIPTPARAGNSHTIGGSTELSMRIGHKTLRSRPSRIPTPTRVFSSRATSSKHTAPSESHANDNPQPTNTEHDPIPTLYRQISSWYLASLLQRTRARGSLLPSVDRKSLLPDQIAWRDVNSGVIEAIYGNKYVSISEAEIGFVERIAAELRGIAGETWIAGLFWGSG